MILFVAPSMISAQTRKENPRVSFGLYQDPNLAFFKDDKGNKPFTSDVRFEFMMEGYCKGAGSTIIGFTIEYADLSEYNLFRYGFQGGYNFRNYALPFNLGYFDNAIYLGGGVIHRNFPDDNQGYLSLELSNDFQIFLNDWMSINFKTTLMQRGDLSEKYNDDSGSFRPWDWRLNNYIGIKLYVDTMIKRK